MYYKKYQHRQTRNMKSTLNRNRLNRKLSTTTLSMARCSKCQWIKLRGVRPPSWSALPARAMKTIHLPRHGPHQDRSHVLKAGRDVVEDGSVAAVDEGFVPSRLPGTKKPNARNIMWRVSCEIIRIEKPIYM